MILLLQLEVHNCCGLLAICFSKDTSTLSVMSMNIHIHSLTLHIVYRNNFLIVQLVRTKAFFFDFSDGPGNEAITQLVSSFVSMEFVIVYALNSVIEAAKS